MNVEPVMGARTAFWFALVLALLVGLACFIGHVAGAMA